jgi:ribonuclease P protein component
MPAPLGRLKKRSEFLRVAASGRKWVTPGLVLQARRRDPQPEGGSASPATGAARQGDSTLPAQDQFSSEIRVGFTTSKKVGSAVERNRARRRLRAVAAEMLPGLGQPGTDYVLIGRGSTVKRPYADLRSDLEGALRRLAEREGGRR